MRHSLVGPPAPFTALTRDNSRRSPSHASDMPGPRAALRTTQRAVASVPLAVRSGVRTGTELARAQATRLGRPERADELVASDLPGRSTVLATERGHLRTRLIAGPPGAPTVLLLHGWSVTGDLNWAPVYPTLASRYSVIAPDHRGHGQGIRSADTFRLEDCADDAAALVRSLRISRVLVAGYSMGGPVALLLARRHPELASGLILCATAAHFGKNTVERLALYGLGAAGFGTRQAVRQVAGRVPALAARLRRHPIAEAAAVAEAGLALAAFDARRWIADLAGRPAVVVRTTADHVVPGDHQAELAALLDAPVLDVAADHAPAVFTEAFRSALRSATDALSAWDERP